MSHYYIPIDNTLTLFAAGIKSSDDTYTMEIGVDQAGTITTLSDDGGLTGFSYEVDSGSGPISVTLPFSVADGDTLTVEFDAAASDTSFTLSGTY